MEHSVLPSSAEDFKAWAKLSFDGREFSIPCKLFLPKTILERPQVYFFPQRTEFDILYRMTDPSRFTATMGDAPDIEIVGEDIHIGGGSMRHWQDGLDEGYIRIYPARLKIRYFRKTNLKNTALFKVTPSLHLSPCDLREYCYNGEAKITHGKRFEFTLDQDFKITLLNHYKWQGIEDKKTITFPQLIAEASLKDLTNEDDFAHYLSIFDDFLLLVSLAEGQRCTSPHVNLYLTDRLVEIYRMDSALPRASEKHSFNDFLIDTKVLKEFLLTAWKVFTESTNKRLIKSAIEINTNDADRTMESHFLSLFSSIETLILAFRIESGLEYILYPGEWKVLRKKIKELMMTDDSLKNDEIKCGLIKQNLSGLNRAPLKYAFHKFITEKNLLLDDLWPFSTDNDDWTLTKIRNRLVHGYRLDERHIDSFGMALENLEYYAKRLLLSTLGWNFKNSKVFRRDDSFVQSWKKAREAISDWK